MLIGLSGWDRLRVLQGSFAEGQVDYFDYHGLCEIDCSNPGYPNQSMLCDGPKWVG